MIRSLRKMMKYAYISPCNDCCRHDCFFIKRAVNYLRTGKCEKNSSGFYLPECFYVQALVAHQCIVAYIKMFGKGGRIKHHHIVHIFFILEKIKYIHGKRFMFSGKRIHLHIFFCKLNRSL